jgi:hypothetical protein
MADPLSELLIAHWFRPTAGADGVAAAERQVREFFVRLAPWSASTTPRIEWRSVAAQPDAPVAFGGAFELASDATMEAVEEEGFTREALGERDKRLPYIADRVLRLHRAWGIAVERGLEVLPATWPTQAVRGRRFAELADPFEPLLELWKLGYVIEADDESAQLYAPTATLV